MRLPVAARGTHRDMCAVKPSVTSDRNAGRRDLVRREQGALVRQSVGWWPARPHRYGHWSEYAFITSRIVRRVRIRRIRIRAPLVGARHSLDHLPGSARSFPGWSRGWWRTIRRPDNILGGAPWRFASYLFPMPR